MYIDDDSMMIAFDLRMMMMMLMVMFSMIFEIDDVLNDFLKYMDFQARYREIKN
jgi:hypothetical protein